MSSANTEIMPRLELQNLPIKPSLEETIKTHSNMVWKLSWYFKKKNYHIDVDDLSQIGFISLIKAYEKFNPSLGYKFITLAYLYCYREMLSFVTKEDKYRTISSIEYQPSSFDEYLPSLNDSEYQIINMLKNGYSASEIKTSMGLNNKSYIKLKTRCFDKIRRSNEKSSIR